MRAISLVQRLEFEFSGNVLRNAVCIGDLDNDGHNELAVGNGDGELAIFKDKRRWQLVKHLGFITSVAIGDIFNSGENSLIVVTGDGWCYIYNLLRHTPHIGTKSSSVESRASPSREGLDVVDGQILSGESYETSNSDGNAGRKKAQSRRLEMVKVHSQRIPPNAKIWNYRLCNVTLVKRMSHARIPVTPKLLPTIVKLGSGLDTSSQTYQDILLADIDGDGNNELVLALTDRVVRSYRWQSTVSSTCSGSLVCLNKWECAKQIGKVSMQHMADGKPALLIAQPGGTFMRIRSLATPSSDATVERSGSSSEALTGSTIDYQFLGKSRMRNPNISTEIVGDLRATEPSADGDKLLPSPYAVATLDGTVMYVRDECIRWSMALDQQIFALEKLALTGDQPHLDNVIACCWDGTTYILDQDRNAVRFRLGEPIQTFGCGFYSIGPSCQSTTCLVYVTFRGRVLLYYDIPLPRMVCKPFSLTDDVVAHFDNADKRTLSANDKRKLVEYLLYNCPNV